MNWIIVLHFFCRFDYTMKLSEIEQLKRDHEVDLSLLDAPQSNWKAMMDKERKSRSKILKTMTTLEKRFVKQKSDMEKEHRRKTEESQKFISDLKIQNESLRKKIEWVFLSILLDTNLWIEDERLAKLVTMMNTQLLTCGSTFIHYTTVNELLFQWKK